MALQLGTTCRDNRLSAISTLVDASTGGTLKIFSGAEPANCAAADPSGLLVTITLPNTAFGSASAGAMAMSGTWSASASATGTAASFRIYDSAAVCHIQGSVTATGSGGDLTLDNTSIASSQTVTVTSFTLTDGNA